MSPFSKSERSPQATTSANSLAGSGTIGDVISGLDARRAIVVCMAAGTLVLLGGLLAVMIEQPFEHVDDLIWLSKLRNESFAAIPFSPAWMDKSNFYRPFAELLLKPLYSAFGLHPVPYRLAQFAALLALLWSSWLVVRRLGLRPETILVLAVVLIGSPFISGSIVWLSELPHVVVLICFAVGLAEILSEHPPEQKLWRCTAAFAIAVMSKENGLALLIFYPALVRETPVRATLAFGGVTLAYFGMRTLVLGPGMGLSGSDESVGYFFEFLTSDQKHELFPGHSIYELYAYNVAAQNTALWLRLTKWGAVIKEIEHETIVQIASTGLIILGADAWRKHRAGFSIAAAVALGATLFSFSYARDRHLALPALAYAFLLAMAIDRLELRWRWVLVCAWLAWAAQAAIMIRSVHRASVDLVAKVYRPNEQSPNASLPQDVWAAARASALKLPQAGNP